MTAAMSLQRADPLGALAGRRLTMAAAVAVVGVSVALTLTAGAPFADRPAAYVSIALTAVAATLLVVRSHPKYGVFERRWAVAVLGFGVGAHFAAVVASLPESPRMDDPGPYVIALLLLALVPYQPVRDTIVSTVVLAFWVGGVTLVQDLLAGEDALAGLSALIAVTVVLALPLAGAAFTVSLLGQLSRWRDDALAATEEEARRQEREITRAVQRTRVDILNRDVVPFYTHLIESGTVTEQDCERAAELAGSIRAVMLADTERSWLEEVVLSGGEDSGDAMLEAVRDGNGLARLMDLDQRTALRALAKAVNGLPGLKPGTVSIALRPWGGNCEALFTAEIRGRRHRVLPVLRPYLAVVGAAFNDFSYEYRSDRLTVRFCYDRP